MTPSFSRHQQQIYINYRCIQAVLGIFLDFFVKKRGGQKTHLVSRHRKPHDLATQAIRLFLEFLEFLELLELLELLEPLEPLELLEALELLESIKH